MKRFRRSLLLLVVALCGSMLVAPGTLARQGADCDGIDGYIEAINATGNPVTTPEETNLPDGFIDEWDADELAAAVEEMQRIQDELEGIEAPPAAEAFHAILIDAIGSLTELIDTVAESGIDAGIAFAEEMESLDTQLYDSGLIVEETCQVALLDHDFDGEPEVGEGVGFDQPTVAAATVTVATIAAPTRSEPVPVGTAGTLIGDWELTVLSVTPDATAEVLAYDPSNTAPTDGLQYFIARVKVTNTGASEGSFSNWRLSIEDPSGRTYAPFIDYCGFIDDELTSDTLAPGESAEGNVCWAIPAAEAASTAALVIFDGDAFPDERIYFSLDGPGDTASDAAEGGFANAVESAGEDAVSGFGTPEADAEGSNG